MFTEFRKNISVSFNKVANHMTSIKPYEIGIAFGMGILAMPFSPFIASIAFALPTLYVGSGYMLKFASKLVASQKQTAPPKPG